MDDKAIRSWAKQFAAELKVADEPGIFDQTVGRHLATLEALKNRLRWKGIVNILTQAGARREDGKSPLTEDQLRASRSRMRRRERAAATHSIHRSPAVNPNEVTMGRHRHASTVGEVQRKHGQQTEKQSKDVSDADIAAALSRISRSSSTRNSRKR